MPYKLRKAPKKDLYWVVTKETGEHHSKEPLPLARAKKQLAALYIELRGGEYPIPPPTIPDYPPIVPSGGEGTRLYKELMEMLDDPAQKAYWVREQKALGKPTTDNDWAKRREVIRKGNLQRAGFGFSPEQEAEMKRRELEQQEYAEAYRLWDEGRQAYLAENPEEKTYTPTLDEDGEPLQMSTAERNALPQIDGPEFARRLELYRSRHRTGFEKFAKGFTDLATSVADVGVDALAKIAPGIGKVAQAAYKTFAPPGSQFYTKGTIAQKAMNLPGNAIDAAIGSGTSCLKVRVERGAGKKNLNMFELFKGTGSVGKVAKRMGFNVVSLDFDEKYNPDITQDLLEWDYKKWAEENKFIPDYIWSSPPCNTYSTLAYQLKERNTKTATPYSARAKEGTAILHRTLEIIRYFQKKNPKLLYTVENPRGMMRHDSEIKKLPNRETTLYCLYGDFKRKPTDFWSNYPMELKPHDSEKCMGKNVVANLADLPTIEQRYSIPSRLIRKILQEAKNKYGAEPLTGPALGSGMEGRVLPLKIGIGKTLKGGAIPSRNILQQMAKASYSPNPPSAIAGFNLVHSTPTLKFYKEGKGEKGRDIVIAIRGTNPTDTTDLKADAMIAVNQLQSSARFQKDVRDLKEFQNQYPPSSYQYYGVGHSLGGAILDAFLKLGLLRNGVSYNPAVQPLDIRSNIANQRIYQKGDPLYETMGRFTPGVEVRDKKKAPGLFDKVISYVPFVGTAYTAYANHALDNFTGGNKPTVTFHNQLRDAGVSPEAYLKKARSNAKKHGLAYKHLGFSSDTKHKLQIPKANGSLVRFGAVGLGDFVLLSLADDPTADERRQRFLARATKIKGDWKKDPYSPNNLAIRVLWQGA